MASSRGDSDGSFTPSDASDASERSDRDSDYESDVEHLESKGALNIQWTGYSKKMPVILFNADCILQKISSLKTVGERYHMAYKFGNSECKIVKNILHSHGFHEVHPNSSDYNLVWTGAHLKPFTLRSLTEFQKINHFPRSYELTRKDRLYKNIQRMQQIKGPKNFDIVPSSYVLPGEYQEFCAAFLKDKGPWIVKPVASSRGRGVFLVNHPDQIPLDENVIVSRYLSNPLLIDGFKFDIRLYVAVTSYDPIQIYLYEEGLTRFATVKYEKNQRHIRNQCMHLTNYSVNKKNDEYVQNDDADVEDYGNKWSIGAMLRYLRSNGKDTAALMMKIEDCIIKTILSVELPIGTACKMFMPFRGNCFELYGFDILIDDNYKPWVLEVNLSPSLACDSPLDLKIKGNMLCDLFALTGIMCHDPMMRTMAQSRRNLDVTAKIAARAKSARFRTNPTVLKQRPSSAGSIKKGAEPKDPSASTNKSMQGLNSDEIKILRRAKEEDQRKGGWVRIFPTSDSWDLYSSFLQFTTSHNLMLHQKLYPERHKSSSTASVARGSTSAGMRAKSAYIQLANNQIKPTLELAAAYAQAILRTKQYERKLGTHRPGRRSKRKRRAQSKKNRAKLVQGVAEDSGDDNENEEEENEEDEKPINEENISARNNPSSSNRIELVDSAKLKEEIIQIVVEKDSSHKQDQGQKRTGLASLSKSVPIQHASGNIQVDVGGVDVDDRTPSPPPVKVEPKYNVVDLLQNGHTLSKVQARTAFAMYLVRVQQRLMTDCSVMSTDDVEGLNEQMDLVLRFLKRAAVNLQQSFKVVVPSRKLPLNDRRRILAKQLGDFVHVYNKDFLKHKKPIVVETEQLRSRKQLEHKHTHLRRAESIEGLNEDKFDRFINIASEGELEEVLTTYTKINKSASIFLGSKTSSETHSGNHVPTTGNSMQHIGATASVTSLRAGGSDTNLSKRRESVASTESVPKTVSGWEDIPKVIYSVPTSSGEHRPPSTHSAPAGPPARNVPASYSTISAASYANAVQVYTQKLTTRPRSATLGQQKSGSHGGERVTRSRPASAQMVRPMSASTYGSASDLQDPYNEKVISEALQRLTMRQQARQYSAFNGTSLLPEGAIPPDHVIDPKEWQTLPDTGAPHSTNAGHMPVQYERANIDMHSGKYIVVDDHLHKSKNRPPSGANQKRGHSSVDYRSLHSRKQTNVNLQNANATFNSFIEDAGANWQNDINAIAYNQVTGVVPQNYHTPSQASKQYQILQQQTLKQQSKALLEQSKAKHQAMIAQAHAVQKSLERVDRPESAMSTHIYAPKPPIKPGTRKATSAHHRVAKRAVPEETSLNFNFYSSSKSAVNGGW